MAKRTPRKEFRPVKAGNAHRFLAAMLQCVKAQCGCGRGIRGIDGPKDSAFLAQLVSMEIEKRVRKVHARSLPVPVAS